MPDFNHGLGTQRCKDAPHAPGIKVHKHGIYSWWLPEGRIISSARAVTSQYSSESWSSMGIVGATNTFLRWVENLTPARERKGCHKGGEYKVE